MIIIRVYGVEGHVLVFIFGEIECESLLGQGPDLGALTHTHSVVKEP